jgi:hypothetical protein
MMCFALGPGVVTTGQSPLRFGPGDSGIRSRPLSTAHTYEQFADPKHLKCWLHQGRGHLLGQIPTGGKIEKVSGMSCL